MHDLPLPTFAISELGLRAAPRERRKPREIGFTSLCAPCLALLRDVMAPRGAARAGQRDQFEQAPQPAAHECRRWPW